MRLYITTAILMAVGLTYAKVPALYECIYRYQMNGKDGENNISETTDCILQIGENDAKFYDYAAFRLDSVENIPNVSDNTREELEKALYKKEGYFDQTLLTSLPDNKVTVYCDMAPDHYRYEQSLPLAVWSPGEQTDTVCGYPCRQANGKYGGREWTVWYAEEIPVPFGPWKLMGLPGLVVKAIDSDNIHSFEAISFRKATGEFAKPSTPNVNSIDKDKFIQRKNLYDRDPFSMINPEGISDMTVTTDGNILINNIHVRQDKKGPIPLEYTESELTGTGKVEPILPKKSSDSEIRIIGVGSEMRMGI